MVIEIAQVIQDFAIIMIVALISYKLKQPLVIGYIIAGIIIGPHTPPFSLIGHLDILNLFAEIGIILLLFVVGMEFLIDKLRNIGKKVSIIATSEALGTFVVGFVVAQTLHYSLFQHKQLQTVTRTQNYVPGLLLGHMARHIVTYRMDLFLKF